MIDLFGTVPEPAVVVAPFDTWYSIYPRKRGKSAARRKWKSRNLDEIASKIIADTEARIKHEWSELKYIPYASTYINGERWLDEIEIQVEPIPKDLDALVSYAAKRGVIAKPGEWPGEFRKRLQAMA